MTTAQLASSTTERLRDLELRAGVIAESVIAGRHESRGIGTSAHFVDHRDYYPGEDPRSIDWRASARSDRLIVKRFEHEGRVEADLLLDASASMDFRSADGEFTKAEFAALLLECFARVLLSGGDAVACERMAVGLDARSALRGGADHLDAVLALLRVTRGEHAPVSLPSSLDALLSRAQRKRLVVVASDLIDDDDAWIAAASALAARGHHVIVMHTLTTDELVLPMEGTWRLRDPESGREEEVNVDAVRDAYLEKLNAWRAGVASALEAAGVAYHLANVDEDLVRCIEIALEDAGARWG